LHTLNAKIPPADDLPATDRKSEGVVPITRTIELLPLSSGLGRIVQSSRVMNDSRLTNFDFRAGPRYEIFFNEF